MGQLDGLTILCFAPRLWPTWGAGTQRTTAFLAGFAAAGAKVVARVAVPCPVDPGHRPESLTDVEIEQVVDPLARVPWQLRHLALCLGLADHQSAAHRRARHAPEYPVSAVFASGPPWSAVREAAGLARTLDVPLIVDMRDEWSANPFQTKLGPLFHALDRRRERRILRDATAITAPYPAVFSALLEPPGARREVIPHGADIGLIERSVGPPPPLDGDAPLVLLFAGARYGMINEGQFVDALRITGTGTRLQLRLVGSERHVRGPVPPGLDIVVRPPVGHAELMGEYDRAHALLALSPRRRGLGWIPSKIPEYLATGRPILGFGAAGSRLEEVLRSDDGAVFVDEADPASLARGLDSLRSMAAQRRDLRATRGIRSWVDVGRDAAALVAEVVG